MRIFHLTILPMLVIAMLTVIVGERVARREVEVCIPVDRVVLLDFADEFELELERLDDLYTSHLDQLADGYFKNRNNDPALGENKVVGLKSIYLFTEKRQLDHYDFVKFSDASSVPGVNLEGQRIPLEFNKAIIIPVELIKKKEVGETGWLPAFDGLHTVYWSRPDSKYLLAIVINKEELKRITTEYLKAWLEGPLAPLRESGTHFSLTSPNEEIAVSGSSEARGAAALIIPHRLHQETWHFHAWDRISKTSHHDAVIIAISLSVAAFFIVCGFLLYEKQRRSHKLARQRVSFVNQVSHELGSPLTNISLNLDLAMDSLGSAGENKSNTEHRLGLVAQEIGRLNRLVGNVLTFSKCDRGVLEINQEQCFPDKVIARLLDSYRPALIRRGIELKYEPGIKSEVETDPDALTQIISNLVSNVEKYAYSGKWLGIKTSLRDEEFIISVMDKGSGIPEEARKRVFQSFERLENGLNEGSSGAGLGLSIATELAKKLGGSLKLVDYEIGCHFELILPVHK